MNYENLKATIAANIYQNNRGKVTAEMVKTAMNEVVNTLGAGYQYMGIAHPSDAAASYDQHVFFIATEPGTYTNKGGLQVADGEVAILKYDTAWHKEVTGAATAAQVAALGQEVGDLETELDGGQIKRDKVSISLPTVAAGYMYTNSGGTLNIIANASTNYSDFGGDISSPVGLDISAYAGKTLDIAANNMSSGSNRETCVANSSNYVFAFCREKEYVLGADGLYHYVVALPSEAKYLYWSALGSLVSIESYNIENVVGLKPRMSTCEEDIEAIEEKTDFFVKAQSANLFNPNDADVVLGKYLNNDSFKPDANYNTSGYIPVEENTTYYKATNNPKNFRFVNYYDSDKNFISGGSLLANFTTPLTCAFVRLSFYADTYSLAQVADTSLPYVPYNIFLEMTSAGDTDNSIATLSSLRNNAGDILYGKKWVACGDSFTSGDFNNSQTDDYTIQAGKYAGYYKVYPYLIGNRNNMNIVNEAVAGSPMTYIDGSRYEFSKAGGRYTQIPADADYITLKFGINDDTAHLDAPIGTIDDNTNTTFYGAWNIVMDYIITNHPQAKIGIIVTNGSQLAYVNAIIAIAQKWGVSYLNEATDEQCSFMFRSNRTDVVSSIRTLRNNHWFVHPTLNQHPNELAHEYESAVIEAWLRTL